MGPNGGGYDPIYRCKGCCLNLARQVGDISTKVRRSKSQIFPDVIYGASLVVVVQHVGIGVARDGALVDGVLSVVLADGLEHVRQLEETVRDAEEPRLAADVRQLRVGHDDLRLLEDAHVGEADLGDDL